MTRTTRQAMVIFLALVLAGIGSMSCSAGGATGVVTVLGPWTGPEEKSFQAVFEKFERDTGIDVRYEGTRDLDAVLATRFQEKNPPDVVVLPSPGELDDLSERGRLVSLDGVLDQPRIDEQYGPRWLRLGQYKDDQKAVVFKAASKGLVWYSPKAFRSRGLAPPTDRDTLAGLGGRIEDEPGSVWCLGLESSSVSGWPGSDWIEDILLHQAGLSAYEAWSEGERAWTSHEVLRAWVTWMYTITAPTAGGRVDALMTAFEAAGPAVPADLLRTLLAAFEEAGTAVAGGPLGALLTTFGDAGNGMFVDPPRCYLHHAASYITEFYEADDFDFFRFSPRGDQHPSAQVVAGDLLGMLRDTTEARHLIRYLTTPAAQRIWVTRGGFISPNSEIRPDEYPDPTSRKMADIVSRATEVAFDASDLMPVTMQTAFYQAVLTYISDPTRLTDILDDLEKVRTLAY